MRKTIAIAVFILSAGLLLLSMNQSFINRIKQDRYFDHLNPPSAANRPLYYRLFVRSDRWRYGDLYGLCYLPEFKFKLAPFKKYEKALGKPLNKRSLYIIGDSFLADKTLNGAFEGFDDVIFLDRRFPIGPIILDTARENYLIMEFAERNLIGYELQKASASNQPPTGMPARLNKVIFNKDLSRNLELLLFDDKLVTPVKELKAIINYKLFGRIAKEVAVSTDHSRLFLNATVDTGNAQSAFRFKADADIDLIAGNLGIAANYYRSIGFKKVFLSVIPNAVSIYNAKRMPYNHLLERVEEKTGLPIIPLYDDFRNASQNVFYKSDAHWNPHGFELWVTETNRTIGTKP